MATYYVTTTEFGQRNGMSKIEEVNVDDGKPAPVVDNSGALHFASGGVVIYAPGTWSIVTGGD